MTTLERRIREAEGRERNDDHLSTQERQELVNLFRIERPDVARELSSNLDEAFVTIVFDL